MTSANFLPPLLITTLCLQLAAVPVIGHAQQPVQTAPNFSTSLNPSLAIPAGRPAADSAKLPPVPISAPPAILPPPVAAMPGNIVAATPLTPGKLDPAMLSWPGGVNPAYRAARTPVANVIAAVVIPGTDANTTPAAAASSSFVAGSIITTDAAIAPTVRQGGRFESVGLVLADDDAKAQPASVSLNFGFGSEGKRVWVHPVDGGTIDGQPGGRFITLGAGGTLVSVFQPPAEAGLYHVVVRLDDVQSVLPFWVLHSRELARPGSPAERVLTAAIAPAVGAQ